MALTPARVVARLLANVEQAGGCVVTLYSVGRICAQRWLEGRRFKGLA